MKSIFKEKWTSDFFFLENNEGAYCLLCGPDKKIFHTFSTFNFKRHASTLHPRELNFCVEKREKLLDFLRSRISTTHQQQLQQQQQQNMLKKKILTVSYRIAFNLATKMKSFEDGAFLKNLMLDAIAILCPDETEIFEKIPLSPSTVMRRTLAIAGDLKEQLQSMIDSSEFYSIAMDESTDIGDIAQLAIYVRGINDDFQLFEEIGCLCAMNDRVTGKTVSEEFIKFITNRKMNVDQIVNITTDGCPSMIGSRKDGFKAIFFQNYPNSMAIFLHCIIHQESLCKKVLGLENVITGVTSVVNFIRGSQLRHRQFKQLLQDENAEFDDIHHHIPVRWLSVGEVCKRVYELRSEIVQFLNEIGKTDFEMLEDEYWLNHLAFTVDLLNYLNILNKKLQGKGKFVHELIYDVEKFMSDIIRFKDNFNVMNFTDFETLQQRESLIFDSDISTFTDVFDRLHADFSSRFKDFFALKSSIYIITDLFNVKFDKIQLPMPPLMKETLIIQSDVIARKKYSEMSAIDFFKSLDKKKYGTLRNKAKQLFVIFGSTYLCECGFSIMKYAKSKTRSRITNENLDAALRIKMSHLKPNFTKLVESHKRLLE